MLSVFNDVKSFFKVGAVVIDNTVFKFHYKLTVVLLIAFSILVNSTQYFGDPIDCAMSGKFDNVVDKYCWLNSYSLVSKETGAIQFNYRKTFKYSEGKGAIDTNVYTKVKQSHYQWIGFVLLIQAGLFYFPRFLWRFMWEEGRVKELVSGQNSHILTDEEITSKQKNVIVYIFKNQGQHTIYAAKFYLCEVLNFCNVIFNIFLTDWFLGHIFWNYGLKWMSYDDLNGKDVDSFHPFNRYFPKETLCDISTGSLVFSTNIESTFCVLPLQVFNEKIYLFLWFYFLALTAITGLFLVYRVITMFSPQLRLRLLSSRARVTDKDLLRRVTANLDIGDWFIIYQIGKNMDPFVFGKLLDSLDETFEQYNGNEKPTDYKRLPI